MDTPIRILIVDDHPVVRSGLASMLATQSNFELMGEAADGSAALAIIARQQPDVVLLDLRMPGMSGIDILLALAANYPLIRSVVLTNYEMNEDIFRAVEAGARGYLLKDTSLKELSRVIQSVYAGRREFPRAIADSLAERMSRATLTGRESQVLQSLVRGSTNKQIGQELGISEHTARNHVINILEKLGVADRTEAVSAAIRQGIVKI